MIIGNYVKVLSLSLIASLICVPIARTLAFRFGVLDHPKSRKIHKEPMPRLGGLALYVAFVIGTLSAFDYNTQVRGILIGSTIIFVVGLVDDIHHLRASFRLLMQILAGVIVVLHGVVVKIFPYEALNSVVTVIGLVGITNALNFLDNMDGLAAGIAAICSFGILAVAYRTGQRWLAYLALSFLGSTVGFLKYNFKPAKIFMGDSGSTFLGFVIGAMSIMASWSEYRTVAITVPILILGLMIFDTTMISVLRIIEGKVRTFRQWLEHADTDHVSHRLVEMGMSQRETVMFLYI
jgi:UDP-GlcNAc:undecaprenyl-phosphate GlcNAc-1-phosphate transferase